MEKLLVKTHRFKNMKRGVRLKSKDCPLHWVNCSVLFTDWGPCSDTVLFVFLAVTAVTGGGLRPSSLVSWGNVGHLCYQARAKCWHLGSGYFPLLQLCGSVVWGTAALGTSRWSVEVSGAGEAVLRPLASLSPEEAVWARQPSYIWDGGNSIGRCEEVTLQAFEPWEAVTFI